jgi:rod shape determining protein RodA
VGEELGFAGVAVALTLFLALLLTLVHVSRRASDSFSSLAVFGVVGLFFTHVIENVGMTINLMPITGIPLPFFSYGGSFILACGIAVGLCYRVGRDARLGAYVEP